MSSSPVVLIVDDDAAVRKAVLMGVEELGWTGVEAEDGVKALEILRDKTFDFVVSDVWMPNMDGVRFVKEALRTKPDMKVLAISGGGSAPAALSLKMLEMYGASDVLYKPFTEEELSEKLLALRNA